MTVLSKVRCPDCAGSGIDARRGGLCGKCDGAGGRRLTKDEYELQLRTCRCRGGRADCTGCAAGY